MLVADLLMVVLQSKMICLRSCHPHCSDQHIRLTCEELRSHWIRYNRPEIDSHIESDDLVGSQQRRTRAYVQ